MESHGRYRLPRRTAALLGTLLLAACSGQHSFNPRTDVDASFRVTTRYDGSLPLEIIEPYRQPDGSDLWVFIEGDGLPWGRDGMQIAADPSPHRALAYEMFRATHLPRVYLGRPCYFGHAADRGCSASLWTADRYGDAVIAGMSAVLQNIVHQSAAQRVVLVGYSGGGALAYALAPKIAQVSAVITLSGNLDTQAWTRLHGYRDLSGSRNPATEAALDRSIRQFVLLAARDENVPPATLGRFLAKENPQYIWTYQRYDHACCWSRDWPTILDRILMTLDQPPEVAELR